MQNFTTFHIKFYSSSDDKQTTSVDTPESTTPGAPNCDRSSEPKPELKSGRGGRMFGEVAPG